MYDQMFDDEEDFVEFFKKNDTEENRKALLKTSKLRYWYCMHITLNKDMLKQINEIGYLANITLAKWGTSSRDFLVEYFMIKFYTDTSFELEAWDKSVENRKMTKAIIAAHVPMYEKLTRRYYHV